MSRRIVVSFVSLLALLGLFAGVDSHSGAFSAVPTATLTPQSYLPYVSVPYPFVSLEPTYLPNCALTQIKGTIMTETGQPLNGVTVRIWWDGADSDEIFAQPSGTYTNKPDGYWEVVLAFGPKAGKWYVAVIDLNTATSLSETSTVYTDVGPCQPGGEGKQIVIVDFVRQFGEHGTLASLEARMTD